MSRTFKRGLECVLATTLLAAAPLAHALERVTLASGFTQDCVRHETIGDRVRLYLPSSAGAEANYMEVPASAVLKVETIPDPAPAPSASQAPAPALAIGAAEPTAVELQQLLSRAGRAHNIDAALLASVVHAESGGRTHALSRAGAQGLMQLMPGTASAVGVKDAFSAAENVEGGTRYLDEMLIRYHDNLAKALAAYNAGPGAVDRYRGVPPFRETRAYVARIIREFNRRKSAAAAPANTLLAKAR